MHSLEHKLISIVGIRELIEIPFCKVLVPEISPVPSVLPVVIRSQWHLDSERAN